jgi:hypothetical protein
VYSCNLRICWWVSSLLLNAFSSNGHHQAKSAKPEDERPKIYLLEFDKRFEVFPEFVFYDFKNPLKLPRE